MRLPHILSVLLFSLLNSSVFSQSNSSVSKQTVTDFNERPKIQWAFKINSPIYASAVVSENVVYVGGLDSVCYAVEIKTGKEKWKFRTKGEIRSTVCISGDKLYLNGGDGMLYALQKSTGNVIWRFKTQGEKKYDFADYFHSSPVMQNGVVYFGSGDGSVYAVDAESGKQVWSFKTNGIVHTTPALDNGKIFFGSFDGCLYALNLLNGELLWKFKTVGHRYFPMGEVQGSPSVFKNLVFFGARDYNVYALDQNKGFCHWNKAFTKGWGLCLNVHDSVLYIGSADERVLMAADPQTGKEFWKKNMEFLVFGNNAYSETMLYLGTTIGKLHGIRLNSGEKVWSFETESYQNNRYNYFKADDAYRDDIYAIIKSNEQFLDVECELGGVFSTPYISNDVMLFTSTNGTLYCLNR